MVWMSTISKYILLWGSFMYLEKIKHNVTSVKDSYHLLIKVHEIIQLLS